MRFLSGNFSNCGQKISAGLWKLQATCAEKSSDSKFFLKGCSFWKVDSEKVRKLFELSVSLLSGNFVETVFLCPCQFSKYTYTFWQKFIDRYCFLSAVKKCLVFWQKFFSKVVKTSFHVSKETLEAAMFLTEIFLRIIFEVWAENILMFVKILLFKVRLNFPKYFFLNFENSYQYCRNLNNNLRTFRAKLRRSVKIPYYISNRFLEEKIVSETVKLFAFHTLSKKA